MTIAHNPRKAVLLQFILTGVLLAGCQGQASPDVPAPKAATTAASVSPPPAAVDLAARPTASASLAEVSELRNQTIAAKSQKVQAAISKTPLRYANKVRAEQLYNDEVTREEKKIIETEASKSGKVGGGISGGLGKLEAEGGAGSVTKETFSVTPQTLAQQVRASLKSLLKKDEISLDIEYEFADRRRIADLEALQKRLKDDFQLDISTLPTYIDAHNRQSTSAAKPVLDRLYEANGHFAIVAADWTIDATNPHRLTYVHPVTHLLSPIERVNIEVLVLDDKDAPITPDLQNELTNSKGSVVPYTIFGTISVPKDTQSKISRISLTPIAIFGVGN